MQNRAKSHKTPFHGDNTGSNPVGDANKIKELTEIPCFLRGAFCGAVKPSFLPPVRLGKPNARGHMDLLQRYELQTERIGLIVNRLFPGSILRFGTQEKPLAI